MEKEKSKVMAIVLAGGSGKRMGASCKKQYLELDGKPVLYYALKVFQDSPLVDEIILVTNEPEYCKQELLLKYRLDKVSKMVVGGKERFHSVYNALQIIEDCGYVLIHDGARPFVTETMIVDSLEAAQNYQACVVGMPVKDTIKIADEKGFADFTPDRNTVWLVQTPQTFSFSLIKQAYMQLMENTPRGITDDAMVVESQNLAKVKFVYGSYENIKITTPEDMEFAKVLLHKDIS